jgi:transcriptional regulator with XRE-family HTH domain
MIGDVQGGLVMAGTAAGGDEVQVPRTLAEKVEWLIQQARPAGRRPLSNQEIVLLVYKVTGEELSATTIFNLRKGVNKNPQMRVFEALARTFGVPAAFFFDDFDAGKAGLLADQVELLALVREAGISAPQFRALLGMDDDGRKVVADLIARTARTVAGETGSGTAGEHGGS